MVQVPDQVDDNVRAAANQLRSGYRRNPREDLKL